MLSHGGVSAAQMESVYTLLSITKWTGTHSCTTFLNISMLTRAGHLGCAVRLIRRLTGGSKLASSESYGSDGKMFKAA